MTKSELLKYIDSMLTQRSDGNIGLLRVRQYVSENMEDMPTHKNDSNTLDALDCVSRKAAIELIERMKPYHQDADDIIEMISNMPSAQPQRWIPCSERLPELGVNHVSEPCVVYCDTGAYGFAYLGIFGQQVMWNCERDDEYHEPLGEVVAWMPLHLFDAWKVSSAQERKGEQSETN